MTKEQARHIYKKVETEGIVIKDTIKQEMEQDKLSKDNTNDKVNPYQNIIMHNVYKDNPNTSQMEQWSILSNVVNYVQSDRNPKNFYELNVKALDQKIKGKCIKN